MNTPTGNNVAGQSDILVGPPNIKVIQQKSASISEAQNGFVIHMQKVDEYGNFTKVATSAAELQAILADYFG